MATTNRNVLRDQVIVDGNREFDLLSGQSFDFTSSAEREISVRVTDRYVGRLDLLSYVAYGTVDMWWLIAQRNEIIFPIEEMYVGQVLVVPSVGDYYQFVNRLLKVTSELDLVFDKRELNLG